MYQQLYSTVSAAAIISGLGAHVPPSYEMHLNGRRLLGKRRAGTNEIYFIDPKDPAYTLMTTVDEKGIFVNRWTQLN